MKTQIIRAGKIVKHENLRLISVSCILLFAILPLLTLAFHVTGKDWTFILKDRKFADQARRIENLLDLRNL